MRQVLLRVKNLLRALQTFSSRIPVEKTVDKEEGRLSALVSDAF